MSESTSKNPEPKSTESAKNKPSKPVEKLKTESYREYIVRCVSGAGFEIKKLENTGHVLDLAAHFTKLFHVDKTTDGALIDIIREAETLVKKYYDKMPEKYKG